MSETSIDQVVVRAIQDSIFRAALQTNPEEALKPYKLKKHELAGFLALMRRGDSAPIVALGVEPGIARWLASEWSGGA